ncbi:hypothetical protein ACPV47_24085 [Vibrio jasicida]|uniref:hypothetical protein n=1 Tax=Vibrio jasicida TaxID=766224 RepID=UPI0040676D78
MNSNSTFRIAEPTWANACVGDNGNPSYVEYSKGFSSAANLLLDEVIGGRGLKHSVDDFVYPICFNMRHSIELRLKGAIEVLIKISSLKSVSLAFDFSGSHDIGNIWNFFKNNAQSIDIRFTDIISKLDSTICDVAAIDATGQTFRYPIDTESKKHLVDVSLINVVVLRKKFKELEKNLDDLLVFTNFLVDEYSLGTFTKKLSRSQLFDLSYDLPIRSSWNIIDFNKVKSQLRVKYNLSSNDFSKAVKAIESNYEMSKFIDITKPLKSISNSSLMVFLEEWIKINPIVDEHIDMSFTSYFDEDRFDKMKQDAELKEKAWEVISTNLTYQDIADICALFESGTSTLFSERYEANYDFQVSYYKRALEHSEKEYKRKVVRLLDKTNILNHTLKSLYFLGHNKLAEVIVNKYHLETKFKWLQDARNKALFSKPPVFGYATY